jgi:hypothetical protein
MQEGALFPLYVLTSHRCRAPHLTCSVGASNKYGLNEASTAIEMLHLWTEFGVRINARGRNEVSFWGLVAFDSRNMTKHTDLMPGSASRSSHVVCTDSLLSSLLEPTALNRLHAHLKPASRARSSSSLA